MGRGWAADGRMGGWADERMGGWAAAVARAPALLLPLSGPYHAVITGWRPRRQLVFSAQAAHSTAQHRVRSGGGWPVLALIPLRR